MFLTRSLNMNHLTNHFFAAAQSHASHGSKIERLLQSELPEIRAELGNNPQIQDVCLMADAGEFITHTLEILAQFAIDAVYGHHISDYAKARISSLVQEHDLSYLDTVDYLDDKHAALKYFILVPKTIDTIVSLMMFSDPSRKTSTVWLLEAGPPGTRVLHSRSYRGSKSRGC